MAQPLPPIPYKQPAIDQSGFFSDIWAKWIRDVYKRIGGAVALTNEELASQITTNLATVTALQATVAAHTTQLAGLTDGLTVGPTL